MSWQAVQPLIAQYSANHHAPPPPHSSRSSKQVSSPQSELGGGILVLDLESYQNGRSDENERGQEKKNQETNHSAPSSSSDTLPIITHFISHAGESLSVMSFSPTGLKLASADTNGQVILVHALVPSGLISHPHQVVGLLSTNRPYLLYKLVRGLTLAKIIDIGFDNSESIAFASSFNGTVHIFDLKATTTESSEIRSAASS
jgi:WD40 repeat protein